MTNLLRFTSFNASFSFQRKFFAFFLPALIFSGSILAQDHKVVLKWAKPVSNRNEEIRLSFDGAQYFYNANLLPWFVQKIEGRSDLQASITDAVYEPLTAEELNADFKGISENAIINSTNVIARKQISTLISVCPFRINSTNKKPEKLISFTIVTSPSAKRSSSVHAARTYASSSVLANGDWYKFAVAQEGVYKVSYSFLRNIGVDLSTLTLQNLRLYGNGGGMLPLLNSTDRPDDLIENAIEVVDADNNGLFNEGDYFMFYGQSPDRWLYSSSEKRFNHSKNLNSDSTYYFFSVEGGGIPKRVGTVSSIPGNGNRNVTSFTDYAFHEEEKYNFIKSGRNWYGEPFDVILQQRFTFSFPNLIPGSANLKSSVLARTVFPPPTVVYSRFQVNYNNTNLVLQSLPSVSTSYTADFGTVNTTTVNFAVNSGEINFDYTFQPYNSSSAGWLNYISLNVTRSLSMTGNQLFFRDLDTLNLASESHYIISNAGANLMLWNTSNPTNVYRQAYSLANSQIDFVQNLAPGALAEYVLFNSDALKAPGFSGKVPNQNLHALGLTATDMIIVAAPQFLSEAQRLADFHKTHDNFKIVIATVPEIFNEFSAGAQDVAAVRDFAKMIYDRAAGGVLPRYLLLFGDGSYDPKSRLNGNTNFIPTFQSENSYSLIGSFTSDDFFGMMDSIEGTLNGAEYIDLGVGRLPVKSPEEAKAMVDKIITYSTVGTVTEPTCCSGSTSRLGDWRNVVCFVADDQDDNLHFNQNERVVNAFQSVNPVYNVDQIVIDAYQQVSTPGGQRYPEVNEAINKRVEKGALLINYTGHGGEIGWAGEAILDINMINNWDNINTLPAFITATCEFSRFDDPLRTSAGELVLLSTKGGGCVLFTTVRLAYASDNEIINKRMLAHMFEPVNGEMPRVGDIQRLAKQDSPGERKLVLLGDPALRLAYPKYNVATTSIEETGTGVAVDTLSALSRVTIKGKVTDASGNTLTGFNGIVYPTIYDKSSLVKTLVNDVSGDKSLLDSFPLRKNILYKGKASVVNGEFSSSFIVPRDISYQYGKGRLSYYAQNGSEDASGYDENFSIGGASSQSLNDSAGPEVSLFMNDEKFVFGGLTNSEPSILAFLSDSSGINTVGNGIGHDITAQLDGEPQKLFVLNDFYESDLDSYQKGKVIYGLSKLTDGPHSLVFKAWDINNNSTEARTEFVVSPSAKLALDHVLNYPNPFTTHTSFFFEHNKACSGMAVQIQVYTVSGKLVKTLDTYLINEGYRNTSLDWDGKDDYGDKLARGVYIYKLKVRTSEGETAQKLEKLVILR